MIPFSKMGAVLNIKLDLVCTSSRSNLKILITTYFYNLENYFVVKIHKNYSFYIYVLIILQDFNLYKTLYKLAFHNWQNLYRRLFFYRHFKDEIPYYPNNEI